MAVNYDFEIIKNKLPEIKQEIKNNINNSQIFNNFIKNISLYLLKDNTLYVLVKNTFAKQCLESNYLKLIQTAINKILSSNLNITFIAKEEIDQKINNQLNYPNNEKVVKNEEFKTNINPKYTFDNLIVSNFNKAAVNAVKSILDRKIWNPIFISGGVGLGKTHLLHAIGNEFLKLNPTAKVLYVNSDTFIGEIYDSLSSNNYQKLKEIKNKYKECDLLLFDDIQFLSKKEKINEFFFTIFNNNIINNLFIIIASDKKLDELKNFEPRMKSRFSSGLIVEIEKPSLESMISILKNKINLLNEGYIFSNEVINYIVRRNQNDVRRLEGFLHQIIFYAINNLAPNSIISVDTVEKVIKTSSNQTIKEYGYDIDPDIVIKNVCVAYGVDPNIVKSKLRKKEISNARNICIYVLRKKFDMPYEQIGKFFANRNHSTIIDSFNKVNLIIEKDQNLKNFIEKLYKNL